MPRTLAQNAQYIAETIKPAIKSAIEAQGVTVPSTDSFLDYADRIGEIEGGGSGYQLKDLPSGSISTVNDAAPLPLNALKVSVEAWQEGSGDPSPSNIRPIHGWSSATITDKDDLQNPTQTETWTHDFTDSQGAPMTCYGGEWNVVDGGMQPTFNTTEPSYLTWTYLPDFFLFQSQIRVVKPVAGGLDVASAIASIYKTVSGEYINTYLSEDALMCIGTNGAIYVRDLRYTNASDFKANSQAQIVFEPFATPTTIPQQPLTPRMLEGVNNLYADCGDIIDGEYFVDEGAIDVRKVDYQIGSSGSIKTTDGRVLSGFASMSGYHARPLDASGNWLDVDWSKDFEIGVAFKFTALPNYQGITGDGNANSYRKAPRIYYDNSEGKLALCVSSDGSTLAIDQYLNYSFVADKWYFIKLKFVLSTMTFSVDVSDDFATFTNLYTGTMSNAPYHNTASLCFGGDAQQSNMASNTFLVDTFNTYIKGDNVNWGAFTGVFPN